jgi:hypothetical protein
MVRHMLRKIQRMGEDHLGHTADAVGRHIGNNNIALAGRLYVHNVIAGGQDTKYIYISDSKDP